MKNIIKVAFVAAVALGSGINVLNSQKDVELSDIGMENVEALSQSELFDGHPCIGTWDRLCCVCGKKHYTYAYSEKDGGDTSIGSSSLWFCYTKANCH